METKRAQAYKKLQAWAGLLACPICGQGLLPCGGAALTCPSKHSFDLSSKGTAQLLAKPARKSLYDARLFAGRKTMLEAGMFDPIARLVAETLEEAGAARWLDAGCGDGALTWAIAKGTKGEGMGLDISQEAIRAAGTAYGGKLPWFVGDVRQLPLVDHAVDGVLNLFTPADYRAFQRVLRPQGILVKVIPGEQHLAELRLEAADREEVVLRIEEGFAAHCTKMEKRHLCYPFAVSPASYEALSIMSPVSAHKHEEVRAHLEHSRPESITVDAWCLIGQILPAGR